MSNPTLRRPVKRTLARRSPARSTRGTRGAAPVAAAALSAHDELVAVKRSLEAVSLALNGIDPDALSDAEHATFVDEMNKVDLAISRVRNSMLEGIVAEFEAAVPSIQTATAKLEGDLAKLQKAVDVINAVSAALGVIEKIIALG